MLPAEVWQMAEQTKARLESQEHQRQLGADSKAGRLAKLSPAPGEEEILVKTQQMPSIEGEMGRVPRLAFSGFIDEEVENLSRVGN